MTSLPSQLQEEYRLRFAPMSHRRDTVWQILTKHFFQELCEQKGSLLDLGAGWGEFVNHIQVDTKYAMDLNPQTREKLGSGITFLEQDCSDVWPLNENALSTVFTSNFFEHLPTKATLQSTLKQAYRCLKPGGRLICLGPNIKYLNGQYWDFWDHYLPLSDWSLAEILKMTGFEIERQVPRFLPFTMVNRPEPHAMLVKLYLKMPLAWKIFGKQFLVVARKPSVVESV